MNEIDFARSSEETLNKLNRALDTVADNHDVEILYQNGVLTLEFEEPTPAKIIVSPNSPVRQIWISAQSTSFKLDWNEGIRAFVFDTTGESLETLIARLIGEELGIAPVSL